MAAALTVKGLLERNSAYAKVHQRIPTYEELAAAGAPEPRLLIITCADPRCVPENYFKLNIGETVVLRTAGADVKSVLPSILSIDTLVKFTDILIVKHTDCGALAFRDIKIREGLASLAPSSKAEINALQFGEITGSLEDSAEQEVAHLRNSNLVRPELKERISGYVYNLETGSLKTTASH